MTIRVAVVDDQQLMRDGFTMILEAQPDIDVVGGAGNGNEGVDLCRRKQPDVVLMDIRMPEMDGLEATRRLIEEFARQPAASSSATLPDDLTDRETEALVLLSKGMSNREIAEHMYIGEATAKTHISHLLTKLGVRDRVQAVVLAYESGLARPGSAA